MNTKLKSILHGLWIGSVAGTIASFLLGALFFIVSTFPDFALLPAALSFGLIGISLGLPIGAVAGAVSGGLLSTFIDPRHSVHFGTTVGAITATCVTGLIFLTRLPSSGADIAIGLGLVLGSTLTGALGGFVFGRLYSRYGFATV